MKSPIFTFFACILTGLLCAGAGAQTPIAPAAPPAVIAPEKTKRATTRTANAVVSAINAKANTLSLKVSPPDGALATDVPVVPESKCRFTKSNRAALLSDFAVGDAVVVRLMERDGSPVALREMADAASFAEKQKQGKEITVGKVVSVSATDLTVLREDGVTVAFRVSPKSVITKADAPVTLATYPAGSTVGVKPRRLPTGGLMASVIAESEDAANWAYHDTLTVWSGQVATVVGDEKNDATITMKRDDGATRSFTLPANTAFQNGRSDAPWATMVNKNITVRLQRAAPGSKRRTASSIKLTGAKPEDKVEKP